MVTTACNSWKNGKALFEKWRGERYAVQYDIAGVIGGDEGNGNHHRIERQQEESRHLATQEPLP